MLHNPSLREEALDRSPVIPHKRKTSIIDWLQSTGRLVARNEQIIEATSDLMMMNQHSTLMTIE